MAKTHPAAAAAAAAPGLLGQRNGRHTHSRRLQSRRQSSMTLAAWPALMLGALLLATLMPGPAAAGLPDRDERLVPSWLDGRQPAGAGSTRHPRPGATTTLPAEDSWRSDIGRAAPRQQHARRMASSAVPTAAPAGGSAGTQLTTSVQTMILQV